MRVYDLSDPERPRAIASWVPETPPGQEAPQTNDLFVDDSGLVFATDRVGGGLYVLRPDEELLETMNAARL